MYTNHSFNYRQETHWRQIVEGQYQRFVPFQVIKGDIGGINISKQAILGPLAGWTLRKRTGRKVGLHDALGSRHPVWEHMIRIAQVSLIQIYIIWNCCKHTQKNQHKRWISICWGTHACILLPIQRSWLARHESHYKIYKCWALKFSYGRSMILVHRDSSPELDACMFALKPCPDHPDQSSKSTPSRHWVANAIAKHWQFIGLGLMNPNVTIDY